MITIERNGKILNKILTPTFSSLKNTDKMAKAYQALKKANFEICQYKNDLCLVHEINQEIPLFIEINLMESFLEKMGFENFVIISDLYDNCDNFLFVLGINLQDFKGQ